MSYYITKYALTQGILEVTDSQFEEHFRIFESVGARYLAGNNPGPFWCTHLMMNRDCWSSKMAAQARARQMVEDKHKSLLKQLKKLGELRVKIVKLKEPT